jgi:hypothetical protein
MSDEQPPAAADDSEFTPEDRAAMLEILAPEINQLVAERIASVQAELDETRGVLRAHEDFATFVEAAQELGIKDEALVDVWELGKWNPEGKETTPEAMKAHFEKAIEGKPHFLATNEPAPKQRLSGDDNSKRGDSRGVGDGKLRATREQLNDLNWMQAHQGEIAKASAAGNFEIIDL